jgi:hypothetical protein
MLDRWCICLCTFDSARRADIHNEGAFAIKNARA